MVYSFDEISIQLNRWLLLVITLFGIFGNVVNMFVFIRPVFNHHVCSWYYFALAVNNGLYSLIVLMYHLLTDGFQIQVLVNSLPLCQFISYITTFCTSLSHYLIVLAAIDRYCASSTNTRHHQFNSFHMMPWSIFLIILFCALLAISSPIITELKLTDELGCNIRSTTIYNQFYLIILLILLVIVAPMLMIIFTLLTMRNRRLAIDRPMAISKCRHMECHLTKVLLLLVTAHIVLSLLEWIEYLMLLQPNSFGPFLFTQTIIHIPIHFSYVMPIICFLIEGKEFRRELKKMVSCKHKQINVGIDNGAVDHEVHQ
jgi:hypothetical protein